MALHREHLELAEPDNVRRLGKWLGVKVDGASDKQVIDRVWRRISKLQGKDRLSSI